MNWRELGYDRKQFHDDDGRIWGEVVRLLGSSEYVATYNDKRLGAYIGMREAQIAIERAHKNRNKVEMVSRASTRSDRAS